MRASNWAELEDAAKDAVRAQVGNLEWPERYACPLLLQDRAIFDEVPEDDWITQADALKLLKSRGIPYTFQGLTHTMNRGDLDVLVLLHAPKQHGRRLVRRSQIQTLERQRQPHKPQLNR